MKDYESLESTADLLETEGWCQRRIRNERGQRCIVGAIGKIAGISWRLWRESHASFLKHLGFRPDCSLSYWNDEPGRTAEEVVRELRTCAKALRKEDLTEA